MGKRGLSFEQFLHAVAEAAEKKFGARDTAANLERIAEHHVRLGPASSTQTGGEVQLSSQPGVKELFMHEQVLVELLFSYYSDLDIDPSRSADHLAAASTLSFKEVCIWGRDFGVLQSNFSDGLSQVRVAKIFQSTTRAQMRNSDTLTTNDVISFRGFQELLCRCAMQMLSTASQGLTVAERTEALLERIRVSKGMMKIEQWLSRTQTDREAMYRTRIKFIDVEPDSASNDLGATTAETQNRSTRRVKWVPPRVGRRTVTPVTRRLPSKAEIELFGEASPVVFNPSKASNPAQQSCLRGYYGC